MQDQMIKSKYILAALGIGLILCMAVTMLFCLSEMKNIIDSNNTIYKAEGTTDSVYHR